MIRNSSNNSLKDFFFGGGVNSWLVFIQETKNKPKCSHGNSLQHLNVLASIAQLLSCSISERKKILNQLNYQIERDENKPHKLSYFSQK